MGYTVNYEGELLFTDELKAREIAYLQNEVLSKSVHEIDGFKLCITSEDRDLSYLDFELNDQLTGLVHSEIEKSYHGVSQLNVIMRLLNTFRVKSFSKDLVDFVGLTGSLFCTGEDDAYNIVATSVPTLSNYACFAYVVRREVHKDADSGKVICPACRKSFAIEGNRKQL